MDKKPEGGKKSEKVRPSILSNEAYNRIVSLMSGHGVTDDEIDYAFEEVFVYGAEATYDEGVSN